MGSPGELVSRRCVALLKTALRPDVWPNAELKLAWFDKLLMTVETQQPNFANICTALELLCFLLGILVSLNFLLNQITVWLYLLTREGAFVDLRFPTVKIWVSSNIWANLGAPCRVWPNMGTPTLKILNLQYLKSVCIIQCIFWVLIKTFKYNVYMLFFSTFWSEIVTLRLYQI